MAQTVFERIEKKYILDGAQRAALLPVLEKRMKRDEYGEHTVCSVYYDTPDCALIRRSLEKPDYKEKLRLRSYGTIRPQGAAFIELKKKYDHVVYKRRIELPLAAAERYLAGGERPACGEGKQAQILREIDWFLGFYQPVPRALTACERSAMSGKEACGLRVTFDENLRCRTSELSLAKGSWGSPLLEQGLCLMEIKIPGAMPVWMAEALSALEIFPTSFSKYGRCFQQNMTSLFREGGLNCVCA